MKISPADIFTIASAIMAILLGIGAIMAARAYLKSVAKTAAEQGTDKVTETTMTNLERTVGLLQTQNTLQAGQIATAIAERQIQDEKISTLMGKVETLSTVPLDKIEKHMADTNNILLTLTQLIPTLTSEHTVVDKTVTTKNSIQ